MYLYHCNIHLSDAERGISWIMESYQLLRRVPSRYRTAPKRPNCPSRNKSLDPPLSPVPAPIVGRTVVRDQGQVKRHLPLAPVTWAENGVGRCLSCEQENSIVKQTEVLAHVTDKNGWLSVAYWLTWVTAYRTQRNRLQWRRKRGGGGRGGKLPPTERRGGGKHVFLPPHLRRLGK